MTASVAVIGAVRPARGAVAGAGLVRSTANRVPGRGVVKTAGRWSGRDDRARDEALIRSLYEEHGRAVLAYATRLLGDRAAAEDVLQETLVRAWRHSHAMVNEKGSVRGWLLTVARNIIIDRTRARASRPMEVAESPATPPLEHDHADGVVNSMVVLAALDKLSDDHRNVLVELYYRGRSVAEAAQALGIPPGTVKSRSFHALRAMRTAMGGAGTEVAR